MNSEVDWNPLPRQTSFSPSPSRIVVVWAADQTDRDEPSIKHVPLLYDRWRATIGRRRRRRGKSFEIVVPWKKNLGNGEMIWTHMGRMQNWNGNWISGKRWQCSLSFEFVIPAFHPWEESRKTHLASLVISADGWRDRSVTRGSFSTSPVAVRWAWAMSKRKSPSLSLSLSL